MAHPRMKLTQKSGALQEAMVSQSIALNCAPAGPPLAQLDDDARGPAPIKRRRAVAKTGIVRGTWTTTIQEGARALVTEKSGEVRVVEGPAQVWNRGRRIEAMVQHVAHPGEFLIVRCRDGGQQHLAGPASVWFDPRVHVAVELEQALQIDAQEAIVVYSEDDGGQVSRRIAPGPATFVPGAGEWVHTFRWHGTVGGKKVPGALEFQKLWLLPDQMYHDIEEVRTADDAVLTVRLMVFFHLRDIERMLATTHDPIGDFVNAATSDVIDFVRQRSFDAFKQQSDQLNTLAAYPQLTARAQQCGYAIDNVVYRGYGAPAALQKMHDAATEARTRLALDRATQQQAQELEDLKQSRALARAAQARREEAAAFEHDAELARKRSEAERAARALDAEAARREAALEDARQQAHFARLAELGVDLTKLLTAGTADRVIELRGGAGAQVHVSG